MKMVAGAILVLAAAVFVPGVMLADAAYRMDTRGRPGGVGPTAMFLLVALAVAAVAAGAYLLLTGAKGAAGEGKQERPRTPEDRFTPTATP
jgi:hypothetical protein